MPLALHPDAQRVLDLIRLAGRPPLHTLSVEAARAVYRDGRETLQLPPEAVAQVRDLAAPGPAGAIGLRLYRPAGSEAGAVLPGLVYFHGGGWVIGDLDTHDGVCRGLANASGAAVIAVDYRLSPEHRFPAAVDDAVAALRFVAQTAADLGVDVRRLAVGGDSAGANMAAVLALMARNGAVPPLRYQLLLYPVVDLVGPYDSYDRCTEGYPLITATMTWFRDRYLAALSDGQDWRASPLRAETLAGVAPALLLTCGHDPLCDEGRAYAARLERDGVRVTSVHLSDHMHGFLTMGRLIRASSSTIRLCGLALQDAFAPA